MGEKRVEFRVLVVKPERKKLLAAGKLVFFIATNVTDALSFICNTILKF
jgi:hypothetical protein